ncbi:hypothetical protein F5B22DRAFT_461865 [Xylaria bambusicola]|uniref:uncharacterized protein n=1 Tax=Xylaria bambusicola TaxID=326684 RepID=UPI002008080C|nr:uncharacterized protein F5B22DRAFT_461865 [Xylaria bambusicola]KAI0522178.1 hypothetical protein F5B22DRAFT_461865 [Xylaria bambusicola]
MPPRRSHRRSRSPGVDAQEPRHSRRRMNEYADAVSITEYETSHAQGNVDPQTWRSHSLTWVDDPTAAAHSDDLVYSNSVDHDLMLEPEWPLLNANDQNETLRGGNYHSQAQVNYSDSTWERLTAGCRYNPNSQTASDPSSEFQPAQHTPPAHPDWTFWEDVSMDRAYRRLSMRARQGSGVQISDLEPYGNGAVYNSTNQTGNIEENDSGESGGEISPVDESQYIHDYVTAENDPWSPECLRRPTNSSDTTHTYWLQ